MCPLYNYRCALLHFDWRGEACRRKPTARLAILLSGKNRIVRFSILAVSVEAVCGDAVSTEVTLGGAYTDPEAQTKTRFTPQTHTG